MTHSHRVLFGFLLMAAIASESDAAMAEEIDRLLAAVNGRVITESDLRLARDLNVLVAFGASAPTLTLAAEVDRLVNREILRQELENFPLGPEDQGRAEQRLQDLRQAYAEIGGITLILRRLGLQSSEIESYLELQVSMIRFIETRFRPFAGVSPEEIETYYRGRLVPELQASAARIPPLAEVAEKIGQELTEEKVGRQMDEWIRDIRRHSRIELYLERAEVSGDKQP